MKTTYKVIAAFFTAIVIVFINHSRSNKKAKKAEGNTAKALQKLNEENERCQQEMKGYKAKTSEQITENEKSVLEFKARIANQKSDAKSEYEKEIAKLNNKNSDMKKKIDDFKTDNKSYWESFKKEFNHEMEELGTAFKDFSVENEDKK